MPNILYFFLQGLRLTLGCIQSQWIWLQRNNFAQSNNRGPWGCEEAVWTSFWFCKYRRIFCIRRFGQQGLCANSSVHPFIWRGKFPTFILNFSSSDTVILPDWTLEKWALSSFIFQSLLEVIGTQNKKNYRILVRDSGGHSHPSPFWKIAKMALFNPCMKFYFFLPNAFIWSAKKLPFT